MERIINKEIEVRDFLDDLMTTTGIRAHANVNLNEDTAGGYITIVQLDDNGFPVHDFELVYSKEYNYELRMMNTNGPGAFTKLDKDRIKHFELMALIAKSLTVIEKRLDRTMKEYRK